MRLKNKTAVVTGGASGIGYAIAKAFVEEGAKVALFDLDLQRAQEAASRICTNDNVFGIACDVGYGDQVLDGFNQAEQYFGRPADILVNNAGLIRQSSILEMGEEDWDFIIRNNLKSVFLCSQRAAQGMVRNGRGGRIISISSIHAVLSEPNCGHYTAAKGGIEAFSRTLATELAEHQITVNFIRPGATYTELTEPMYTDAVKKSLFERVPLKQIAEAKWIAAGAVFLASDESRYMTGQDLTLDGGYVMDGSLPGAKYWQ